MKYMPQIVNDIQNNVVEKCLKFHMILGMTAEYVIHRKAARNFLKNGAFDLDEAKSGPGYGTVTICHGVAVEAGLQFLPYVKKCVMIFLIQFV